MLVLVLFCFVLNCAVRLRPLCLIRSNKVYAASSLPHTPLSRYIESRVRQRLAKLEDDAAAATLSIRLISNVEVRDEERETRESVGWFGSLVGGCPMYLVDVRCTGVGCGGGRGGVRVTICAAAAV